MTYASLLVVEDEAIVRMDICIQLRGLGYEVVGSAGNGAEAIAIANTKRPDLVLMDIHLAGDLDGIETAQILRNELSVPVVFLTAFSSDEVLNRAKVTEPFGYILKPFAEQELRTVIEMALYRSQADARLRESEQRFRAIFEAEPECVKVVSCDGVLLQMNAAGLAILEADSLEEAASRAGIDYLLDPYRESYEAIFRSALAGESRQMEYEIVGLRGTHRWLESHVAPMRNSEGQVTSVLAVTRDITDRKTARHNRRVNEQIIAAISQGVIIADGDRVIVSVNNAFEQITGYAPEEVIGRNCNFLQGAGTDPEAIIAMRKSMKAGLEYQGELCNYRKDGSMFWNELTITPVRDDRGAMSQFIGVTRDISLRKEAEVAQKVHIQQMRALSKRVLEAQETERRRVAYELHDELGQSLTAIKINLQSHERNSSPEMHKFYADNISIVDDALNQVRRLATALRPSLLDDLGLVAALGWIAEQNAARGGISVQLHCPVSLNRFSPELETACFRIVQEALTNILRHAHCTRVDITLTQENDQLELMVHDDGRGFDVPAMRARAANGKSLGVMGMQERAELVGGSLVIVSELGVGTTIKVRCPTQGNVTML